MIGRLKDLFKSISEFVGCTERVMVEVELRNPGARSPYSLRRTDAGWDIQSLVETVIRPGDIVNINTGMAVVCPAGYYFSVEGRSSLYRVGVVPFRGIIDGGYLGDLTVSLMNVSREPYTILAGDRIAQLVLHKIVDTEMVVVNKISQAYDIRGRAGFGSSGR